jgi:molecular chaperone DnaK (HSP70)
LYDDIKPVLQIGIPPAPRGIPQIEVTFDIDANGIVNVHVNFYFLLLYFFNIYSNLTCSDKYVNKATTTKALLFSGDEKLNIIAY